MVGQPKVVEYDASQHPIHQVTVFQYQRAEVTRTIQVTLSNGLNSIEVKCLPNNLDRDSIVVEGLGSAVILDVVYHAPESTEIPREELEPELVKTERVLEQRLEIGRRQAAMLKSFSGTFTAQNTTPDAFEAFLDIFANRQNRIDKATTALKDELSTLRTHLDEAAVQRKQDRDKKKSLRTGISIMVSAAGGKRGEIRAEIKLTYAVSGAWWAPHYDVRAVAADTGKGGNDTIHLHYQALVAQSTGEDWSDVALSLSTSMPMQQSTLPKLEPRWLSTKPKYSSQRREPYNYVPIPGYRRSRSRSPQVVILPASRRASRSRSRRRSRSRGSRSPSYRPSRSRSPRRRAIHDSIESLPARGRSPEFMRTINAQPSDNAVSTTYAVAGLASIPSGDFSKRNISEETHKVTIAELHLASAVLEWSCVPSMALGVHLQCRIFNDSNYALLAGNANIFLNNSFISKTEFPRAMPQEEIICSFGTDPALKVTYHPRITKTKQTGIGTPLGINIGNKTSTTTNEQNITVRNSRTTRIGRLIVKDQIPVSREESIKVVISEPKELKSGGAKSSGIGTSVGMGLNLSRRTSNSGSTSTYTGSKHDKDKLVIGPVGTVAQAMWSPMDDSVITPEMGENFKLGKNENLGASLGLFEWVCQLDPGASIDLKVAWEVSAPVGTMINSGYDSY